MMTLSSELKDMFLPAKEGASYHGRMDACHMVSTFLHGFQQVASQCSPGWIQRDVIKEKSVHRIRRKKRRRKIGQKQTWRIHVNFSGREKIYVANRNFVPPTTLQVNISGRKWQVRIRNSEIVAQCCFHCKESGLRKCVPRLCNVQLFGLPVNVFLLNISYNWKQLQLSPASFWV